VNAMQMPQGAAFNVGKVPFPLHPLFPGRPRADAMGAAPAFEWHLTDIPTDVDESDLWDLCHQLQTKGFGIAGSPTVEFAEPDLEQQWIVDSPDRLAAKAFAASAVQEPRSPGFALPVTIALRLALVPRSESFRSQRRAFPNRQPSRPYHHRPSRHRIPQGPRRPPPVPRHRPSTQLCRWRSKPVHMLIDCGVVLGTPDPATRMKSVVGDIARSTDSQIDLLVVTHEHWDHVSAFIQVQDLFENLKIKQVWVAWTEDPADPLANKLRAEGLEAICRPGSGDRSLLSDIVLEVSARFRKSRITQ
jgi:hypothetical protein